jgi:2',3'-cyclic-nucleotide 2'-phosphodiesterase (5'-nucleotidase family)
MKKLFLFFLSVISLFILADAAQAGGSVIRILYVNDFHGFAEPYKPYGSNEMLGGISFLAAEAERLRKEKPTLLLAAGDMIQGANWANMFLGESVIELMNGMRFDAMELGNHEFDFGLDILRKRISEARFPVLCANVEGLDMVKPYIVREISGIKIAVIGVVTEDVPASTHPRNVAGLKFDPPADVVQKYVKALRDKADIIIVLSHIGHSADRELAGTVPGLTAIIGGHSHTKVLTPVMIGNTAVVQAWEHGKALGVLDLTLEDKRVTKAEGRLLEIRPGGGISNSAVQELVEKYEKKVDAVLDETIGEALTDLDGENVRRQETNLGDLVADIIKNAAHADAAIIGGGSIRTSIKKGEIKVKQVYSVSPFDSYVVAVRLTGRQLREALEHGVSATDDSGGRFPQVSGLSFVYTRSAPVGSRVKEVRINGQKTDPDKEYVVATNDFLAAGGDGYKVFGEAVRSSKDYSVAGGMMKGEKLAYSNSGKWVRDVIIDYIKDRKKISSGVEGRIIEVQ